MTGGFNTRDADKYPYTTETGPSDQKLMDPKETRVQWSKGSKTVPSEITSVSRRLSTILNSARTRLSKREQESDTTSTSTPQELLFFLTTTVSAAATAWMTSSPGERRRQHRRHYCNSARMDALLRLLLALLPETETTGTSTPRELFFFPITTTTRVVKTMSITPTWTPLPASNRMGIILLGLFTPLSEEPPLSLEPSSNTSTPQLPDKFRFFPWLRLAPRARTVHTACEVVKFENDGQSNLDDSTCPKTEGCQSISLQSKQVLKKHGTHHGVTGANRAISILAIYSNFETPGVKSSIDFHICRPRHCQHLHDLRRHFHHLDFKFSECPVHKNLPTNHTFDEQQLHRLHSKSRKTVYHDDGTRPGVFMINTTDTHLVLKNVNIRG